MFSPQIKSFFEGDVSLQVDKSGVPTRQDIRIAVVVLMVVLAREDNDFAAQEGVVIAEQVSKLFKLNQRESENLVDLVTPLSKDFHKIGEFVEAINGHFSAEQKQFLLAMIWKVARADGVAHKMETRFAAKLRVKLNLSMEQAVRARHLAEQSDEKFEEKSREVVPSDTSEP